MSYDQKSPYGAAPQAPVAYPGPQGAPEKNPGKTLGIVGFVFSFLFALVGLILSIVALNKSRAAGYSNGLAVAGIVISAVVIVGGVFSRLG
ncbi:hypothetical protein Slu03_12680 [Sediminihabitans luteus]|uniref:DUF4190 domain-containing protein n=1 Tax=Sediminihabitans luteus TaxID=1138585 RepID=UPI000C23558A|nr:DUF4190 domain-containing protein [Sediminihabitans luteus]GII98890.1 hypothetical protein Slu03_12680 [Sediminihabitans luteus]